MKRFAMIFSQVLSVFSAFKVRTAIAVIGVLLGAMALVLVQNISASLQKKVENDIKAFGDRVFTIHARSPRVPGLMMRRERIKSMKINDTDMVLSVINVLRAAPVANSSAKIKYNSDVTSATIIGTSPDYFIMKGMSLADGRIFDQSENEHLDKVAVIGKDVADELFKNNSPLGATIFIGSITFEVIGVLQAKGADTRGTSMDNIIVVPVRTALSKVLNQDYLNSIIVQIRSWEDYDTISRNTVSALRVQHGLSLVAKDDFDIVNPSDEEEFSTTIVNLASLLGSASAGVAFLIGGIGIFSLMLLIVSQRITEIGIKRAIGATKRDILLQFIMESGYIGLLGGALGIIVGCFITLIVSAVAGLPFMISPLGVCVGFFASLFSGMAAGLYPALRASKILPVEALRL